MRGRDDDELIHEAEVDEDDVWEALLVGVDRMSRDIRRAALTLGDTEVRHLVDSYYTIQEDRKRSKAQSRALTESGEPHAVINWLALQSETLEKQIRGALDVYTQGHVMGSYMRNIVGIGPVISAGLLAHIYMGIWCTICHGHNPEQCKRRQEDRKLKLPAHHWTPSESSPTVGHLWAFAGWAADGQKPWQKGERRPFNDKFRTLLWKAGQSFMKLSNHPQCFYGRIYRERKEYETAKNEKGDYAAQAAKRATQVGKDTQAYQSYSQGKLPAGHIDARARRYAVKLFLAHLHGEWYEKAFGKPAPLPYPVAHLGHAHIIPPPGQAPRSAAE